LSGNIGHAQISVHNIDTRSHIFSSFETNDLRLLAFNKVYTKYRVIYLISLLKAEPQWHNFKSRDLDINIDDEETLYHAKFVKTEAKDIEQNKPNNLTTWAEYEGEYELITKLKNANKVTITAYFEDEAPLTFQIPDNILQEWKTVIDH